jgi:hypothetical protein
MAFHNGRQFSAKDKDVDAWSRSCAQKYKGGWWYRKCHNAKVVSTSYDSWIHNCFLLLDLKKSSPLKPLSQMNRNLVGSIYLSSK